MIDRYHHPVSDLFAPDCLIAHWQHLTIEYAVAAMPRDDRIIDKTLLRKIPAVTADEVRIREAHFGHDVVAFLSVFLEHVPEDLRRYVHLGLTSSDLVEFAHHQSLRQSLLILKGEIHNLGNSLHALPVGVRVGRTHGQFAEPTTLTHRRHAWFLGTLDLERDIAALLPRLNVLKSPGPTGADGIRGLDAVRIAEAMHGSVRISTQVVPRDLTLTWASLMLRAATLAEDVATQIWLGSQADRGEMMEGGVDHRVGSSAMPHKRNPIASERVRGLARIARGSFLAVAEGVSLFDDRDLSNSSTERVAVPDLATVACYMTALIADTIDSLQVDEARMALNLRDVWQQATSSVMQAGLQAVAGLDPLAASSVVRSSFERGHRGGVVAAIVTYLSQQFNDEIALEWESFYEHGTAHWRALIAHADDREMPSVQDRG